MYALGIVCGSCIRNHLKEDQTILRQTSSVRYGASGIPHPSAKTVLMHTWERLWGFIKKAGTILFLACVVM